MAFVDIYDALGRPPTIVAFVFDAFCQTRCTFSIGLKVVNIFFCSVGMFFDNQKSIVLVSALWSAFYLFLFFSVRIVNRTYSLLMAAIFVAAYYYHQRMQKSFHLALTLVIMSGAQAYGMMIAIGIAIVWILEILKENGVRGEFIIIGMLGLFQYSCY